MTVSLPEPPQRTPALEMDDCPATDVLRPRVRAVRLVTPLNQSFTLMSVKWNPVGVFVNVKMSSPQKMA